MRAGKKTWWGPCDEGTQTGVSVWPPPVQEPVSSAKPHVQPKRGSGSGSGHRYQHNDSEVLQHERVKSPQRLTKPIHADWPAQTACRKQSAM